jgi:hypothetical protein
MQGYFTDYDNYTSRFFMHLYDIVKYYTVYKSKMSEIERIKYLTNVYKYFAQNINGINHVSKFGHVNCASFIQMAYNNGIDNLMLIKKSEQKRSTIKFYTTRMEDYLITIKRAIENKNIKIHMKNYNYPVLRRSSRLNKNMKSIAAPEPVLRRSTRLNKNLMPVVMPEKPALRRSPRLNK